MGFQNWKIKTQIEKTMLTVFRHTPAHNLKHSLKILAVQFPVLDVKCLEVTIPLQQVKTEHSVKSTTLL